MPPKKKRDGSDADSPLESIASSSTKRQRVSRACDACRTAREKCDGTQPQCGTCTTQNRICSYTPTSKKRGVQTGYLRTIELLLAWSFENVPESEVALHQFLTQQGTGAAHLLRDKGAANNAWHKKWTQSRISRDISRLLSGDQNISMDSIVGESDSDGENNKSGQPWTKTAEGVTTHSTEFLTPSLAPGAGKLIYGLPSQLPSNWERLFDIYFTYIHCWIPIIDRDTLTASALSYGSNRFGLDNSAPASASPEVVELWAVLALSSFHDAASETPSTDEHYSPATIMAISRQLLSSPEEESFGVSHGAALLLHALVLLGQEKNLPAWLMIGKATRVIHYATFQTENVGHTETRRQKEREHAVLSACQFLDVLVSVRLRQPLNDVGHLHQDRLDISGADSRPMDGPWTPLAGFGNTNASARTGRSTMSAPNPLLVLQQLSRFSRVLSRRSHEAAMLQDLVESLDPQFAFCNSLLLGSSTPPLPSAFLVQLTFLAASIQTMASQRPSLLSSFLEVMESCIAKLGTCGAPPICVTLMELAIDPIESHSISSNDQTRWQYLKETLRSAWQIHEPLQETPLRYNRSYQLEETEGRSSWGPPFGHISPISYQSDHGQTFVSGHNQPHHSTSRHPMRSPASAVAHHEGSRTLGATPAHAPSDAGVYFGTNLLPRAAGPVLPQDSHQYPTLMECEAILEELGSLDCADNIGIDPQFMTNLGFAPGGDLGDVLQTDFDV